MKFIIRLLVTGIALAIISYFSWFHVHADSLTALIEGAIVLGLLNAILRPILLVVSCPLEILTLGLFTLIINALIFYWGLHLIPGWSSFGGWDAFWAAIVMTILSWILSLIFGERREDKATGGQQAR